MFYQVIVLTWQILTKIMDEQISPMHVLPLIAFFPSNMFYQVIVLTWQILTRIMDEQISPMRAPPVKPRILGVADFDQNYGRTDFPYACPPPSNYPAHAFR